MTSDFDVIISGAGPAGSTAALAPGSSGLCVALIDKERFPREKVCGDAIPAYVPKVLVTIDPSYRAALDIRLREKGMVCRRSVFDSFLLDLASGLDNLTALTGTHIKNIRTGSEGVTVSTGNGHEINARLLIGFDGSTGVSKRILPSAFHT